MYRVILVILMLSFSALACESKSEPVPKAPETAKPDPSSMPTTPPPETTAAKTGTSSVADAQTGQPEPAKVETADVQAAVAQPSPASFRGSYRLSTELPLTAAGLMPENIHSYYSSITKLREEPAEALLDFAAQSGVPQVEHLKSAIPSALQGKLNDWMNERLKSRLEDDTIKAKLDQLNALAETVLTKVTLVTEIDAAPGGGTHRLRALQYTVKGHTLTLPIPTSDGPLQSKTQTTLALNPTPGFEMGDHHFGLEFGSYAYMALNILASRQLGGTLEEVLTELIDCGEFASSIAEKCVFGKCIEHRLELVLICEGGVRGVVAKVESKFKGLNFEALRLELGTASLRRAETSSNPEDRYQHIDKGKWKATLDMGKGPRDVKATFSGHGIIKTILADMSNSLGTTRSIPLRGRVYFDEKDTDPKAVTAISQIIRDELADEPVVVSIATTGAAVLPPLATLRTDDEGYLSEVVDISAAALDPGEHILRLTVRGQEAGQVQLRILADEETLPTIRSDVDMTYLETDFHSASGVYGLITQTASEKHALPAMETIYRAMTEKRSLVFLSGSPRFFRRVLERKMLDDQIPIQGLWLKPFKGMVTSKLSSLDLTAIVPALKEQIGYKLAALFALRLEIPPGVSEILMGDDTEADHVIYALYHRFTSGELDEKGLADELVRLEVAPSWQKEVNRLAGPVKAHLGGKAPVVAIYINATSKTGDAYDVADWTIPKLTRYHQGAWPLALDLFEEGVITLAHAQAVRARLLELGQSADDLKEQAQAGVDAGFLAPAIIDAVK